MLNKTGTGALTGPLKQLAQDFKAEMRRELGFPGFGIQEELLLEQATQGFLRSQRAVAFELSREFDGTVSLATSEASAGTTLMNAALDKIKDAREKYPPKVQRTLDSIRETQDETPSGVAEFEPETASTATQPAEEYPFDPNPAPQEDYETQDFEEDYEEGPAQDESLEGSMFGRRW